MKTLLLATLLFTASSSAHADNYWCHWVCSGGVRDGTSSGHTCVWGSSREDAQRTHNQNIRQGNIDRNQSCSPGQCNRSTDRRSRCAN